MNFTPNKKNFISGHFTSWRIHMSQSTDTALQRILSYLPYKTLCVCMTVSKSWRKFALDELQTRCSVTLSCNQHFKTILQKIRSSIEFRVGKCTVSNLSLEFPYVFQVFARMSTTLHYLKLHGSEYLDEDDLFRMLNLLPNVSYLSVILAPNAQSRHLCTNENIRFPTLCTPLQNCSCASSPNPMNYTESTVYKNITRVCLDFGPHNAFQFSKIFHLFPNLVMLSIANVLEESGKHFKPCHSPDETQLCNLKHLNLRQYSNVSFSDNFIHTLLRLKLHLQHLSLIFHPPSKTQRVPVSSNLQQFIESQGSSLETLKVAQVEDTHCPSITTSCSHGHINKITSQDSWNFNFSSAFPLCFVLPLALPNLKVLHVQKPLVSNLAQVLHHHPNLEELSIRVSHGANWKGFVASKMEPHEKITRLQIDFIDSDSFARLGWCFPSLQCLHLGFCDKSLFYVLCELIPYFHGGRNLTSCQQCHGACDVFYMAKKGDNVGLSPKDNAGNGTDFNDRTKDAQSDENGEPKFISGSIRNRFKNLTFLSLKLCKHYPVQEFVFLPGEHCSKDQNLNNELFGQADANGFSWEIFNTMEINFQDFPVTPNATENESCSSA